MLHGAIYMYESDNFGLHGARCGRSGDAFSRSLHPTSFNATANSPAPTSPSQWSWGMGYSASGQTSSPCWRYSGSSWQSHPIRVNVRARVRNRVRVRDRVRVRGILDRLGDPNPGQRISRTQSRCGAAPLSHRNHPCGVAGHSRCGAAGMGWWRDCDGCTAALRGSGPSESATPLGPLSPDHRAGRLPQACKEPHRSYRSIPETVGGQARYWELINSRYAMGVAEPRL